MQKGSMMLSCLFTNNSSNTSICNRLDTVNILNLTNCNFTADTISMAVLIVSTFSVTVLLYLVSFFASREKDIIDERMDIRRLSDPNLRFYVTLTAPSTVRFLLISSQVYLATIFLCLLNYFLNSCGLLYISLFLVLINSIFVVFIFIVALVKATIVTTKDYEEYLSGMEWLREEDKTKAAQNKRKKL